MLESPIEHSKPAYSTDHELSIGRLLIRWNKVKEEDVERVLVQQRIKYYLFGEIAKSIGLITDADIQAVLDFQRGKGRVADGAGVWPAELIMAKPTASLDAEVFREIRLQLMQRRFSNGHKVLAFVSVDEQIGTSFFIANLALTFAQANQPTLLIDANLRRPRQDRIFNVTAETSLVELLSGPAHANTVPHASVFRQLSVLKAGRTTPASPELLGSSQFPVLIHRLSSYFDVTLIDLPALNFSVDALAVTAQVGDVVLVARKHTTRLTDVSAAETKLKNVGAQVVGSVLIDF